MKKEKNVKLEENNTTPKKKKHIVLKVLLVLLIVVVLFVGFKFVSSKLDSIKADKIRNNVSKINETKTSYVFIEINPSLVITIKGNEISDVACLNDDCVSIYNDLDIKGKNINDGIDTIYNVSKEKGFDTSKGVKVSSNETINLETKDYITFEYIDDTKEKELLDNIKNNEGIKEIDNDDYYTKLWEELKKDSAYGKVYSCDMNDNKELECYITLETGINKDSDYNTDTQEQYNSLFNILSTSTNDVLNTLKKFNFDVRNNHVYINNIEFGYVPLFTTNEKQYKNALSAEKVDILSNEICTAYANDPTSGVTFENGKCQCKDGGYVIPLEKVNLVNPISSVENMLTVGSGLKERLLQQYEYYKMMNN